MSLNSILIAEDDVFISEHLKQILLNLNYKVYDVVSSYEMAVNKIDVNNLPDLALLDIRMHNEDQGIRIAEYLKNINVPFVYITSFSDKNTLKEAIIHQPKGYIVKPFTPEEVKKMVVKVLGELTPNYLLIKDKDLNKKLQFAKIMFLKSDNNYVEIHTPSKIYLERVKLADYENLLPPDSFFRVHRSYLINKHFIEGFNNNTIVINKIEIPVSRQYKHNLDLLQK